VLVFRERLDAVRLCATAVAVADVVLLQAS
jgi:hypothetical protein